RLPGPAACAGPERRAAPLVSRRPLPGGAGGGAGHARHAAGSVCGAGRAHGAGPKAAPHGRCQGPGRTPSN
ncbi:hypothetical protein HaLaN_18083, partial [Haematococcus lacustris]